MQVITKEQSASLGLDVTYRTWTKPGAPDRGEKANWPVAGVAEGGSFLAMGTLGTLESSLFFGPSD